MEQPHGGKGIAAPSWPQLQMVGLKTPRPPLELRRPRLLIGSAQGAQIRLKSSTIDARHAELTRSDGGYVLRDLSDSSGTFVNEARVVESELKDGDRIRVGRFVFLYVAAAKKAAAKIETTDRAEEAPLLVRADAPAMAAAVLESGPSAAAARLRPVVGRRRRVQRFERALGSAEAPVEAGDSRETIPDEEEEEPLEPQTPRGKAAGYLLLMLVCMAVAALLAWRYSPPTYFIRAAITFRGRPGEALAKNQAYLDAQQALFLGDQTRTAAVKRLAHSADHSTDRLDPGFLVHPSGLPGVGSVGWEAAADRPAVMTLVYTLRSRAPRGDIARADALMRAFTEHRSASTRPTLDELKMRLLQAEVDDLGREAAFRSHRPDQVRRQIETLENATPSEVEISLMERREASLRAAVENTMQDRIAAQLGAAAAAHRGATSRAAAGATQPAAGGEKERLIAKLREREASLEAEWSKSMRDLAEAKVRAQWLMEQKRKIADVGRDLPALKEKLKRKSTELAEMKKASGGVEVFALEGARVAEVRDDRGLRAGVAVGGVAVVFGLLMVLAAQGRVPAPDRADK